MIDQHFLLLWSVFLFSMPSERVLSLARFALLTCNSLCCGGSTTIFFLDISLWKKNLRSVYFIYEFFFWVALRSSKSFFFSVYCERLQSRVGFHFALFTVRHKQLKIYEKKVKAIFVDIKVIINLNSASKFTGKFERIVDGFILLVGKKYLISDVF